MNDTMTMRVTSIEPITWKVSEPLPGEFRCMCCHGVNGNATHFVHAEVEGEYTSKMKLPACAKCAEYARAYPTWLEEMLFKRRMEAAKATMPEHPRRDSVCGEYLKPATDAGF